MTGLKFNIAKIIEVGDHVVFNGDECEVLKVRRFLDRPFRLLLMDCSTLKYSRIELNKDGFFENLVLMPAKIENRKDLRIERLRREIMKMARTTPFSVDEILTGMESALNLMRANNSSDLKSILESLKND